MATAGTRIGQTPAGTRDHGKTGPAFRESRAAGDLRTAAVLPQDSDFRSLVSMPSGEPAFRGLGGRSITTSNAHAPGRESAGEIGPRIQ